MLAAGSPVGELVPNFVTLIDGSRGGVARFPFFPPPSFVVLSVRRLDGGAALSCDERANLRARVRVVPPAAAAAVLPAAAGPWLDRGAPALPPNLSVERLSVSNKLCLRFLFRRRMRDLLRVGFCVTSPRSAALAPPPPAATPPPPAAAASFSSSLDGFAFIRRCVRPWPARHASLASRSRRPPRRQDVERAATNCRLHDSITIDH